MGDSKSAKFDHDDTRMTFDLFTGYGQICVQVAVAMLEEVAWPLQMLLGEGIMAYGPLILYGSSSLFSITTNDSHRPIMGKWSYLDFIFLYPSAIFSSPEPKAHKVSL